MSENSTFLLGFLGFVLFICATIIGGCRAVEGTRLKELETNLKHIEHMAEMGFEQQKIDKTTTTVVTKEEIIWVKQ